MSKQNNGWTREDNFFFAVTVVILCFVIFLFGAALEGTPFWAALIFAVIMAAIVGIFFLVGLPKLIRKSKE